MEYRASDFILCMDAWPVCMHACMRHYNINLVMITNCLLHVFHPIPVSVHYILLLIDNDYSLCACVLVDRVVHYCIDSLAITHSLCSSIL